MTMTGTTQRGSGQMTVPATRRVGADEFKLAFRNHPAGVAVVAADAGSGPAALTATSVFSVSVEPPLLVFSVTAASSATPTILAADTLVVHLIGDDQLHLARLCSTSGADRFGAGVEWGRLETGEPYYTEAPVWIRGQIAERIPAGGSTLVVVRALTVPDALVADGAPSGGHPLVYHNRTWHALGPASLIADPVA